MATAILGAKTTLLIILATILLTSIPRVESATSLSSFSPTVPNIPLKTDDGQDPITLIFTGYAPAWWVSANVAGWSDSAYCSGPKTINGSPYNYTLEHPDPAGIPCYGPRGHLRIWDMGYNPVFGVWSIGSAHHEHTVCDPFCHHVIDNWKSAESDVSSSFLNGKATVSTANYTLPNSGSYQSIFFDGNATMIQLRPPSSYYPVVFSETGLSNQTSWSVTVNGTTANSARPDIVFDEPNGTYLFTINAPAGFDASPQSGRMTVSGTERTQTIAFNVPWTSSTMAIDTAGRTVSIEFSGNATVIPSTVQISTNNNTIRFTASEKGPRGVLVVTVPGSVVSDFQHVFATIDGVQTITDSTSNVIGTNVTFALLYGTHSVELRFTSPVIYYQEFINGLALAGIVLGVLSIVFLVRWKKRRDAFQAPSPDGESRNT